VIKRMLWAALVAEGELPQPAGNDAVRVFSRINIGSADV
jgi:hypothetical protein